MTAKASPLRHLALDLLADGVAIANVLDFDGAVFVGEAFAETGFLTPDFLVASVGFSFAFVATVFFLEVTVPVLGLVVFNLAAFRRSRLS